MRRHCRCEHRRRRRAARWLLSTPGDSRRTPSKPTGKIHESIDARHTIATVGALYRWHPLSEERQNRRDRALPMPLSNDRGVFPARDSVGTSRRVGRHHSASRASRARCRALLIEAVEPPSSVAASAVPQLSTSHNKSAARWRGGSCWITAIKASCTASRAA